MYFILLYILYIHIYIYIYCILYIIISMTVFGYTPVIVITLNITEHYLALLQK